VATPYYNLMAEMARKNIKQKDIANLLEVAVSGASDRIRGKQKITFDEAIKIQGAFFPDIDIKYLFSREAQQ